MSDWLDPLFLIQTLGLLGVFVVIFAETGLFFGFFLPGDSLLFTAGFLASQGFLPIGWLFLGCLIAAVLGDSVGYWFGRWVGPKIFTKEDSFFFRKSHIDKTQKFYVRYGAKTIAIAKFVPIVRTFASILAGVGLMNSRTFLIYNIIGSFFWCLVFIGLGYSLGSLVPQSEKYITLIILGVVVVSFLPPAYELWRERRSIRNEKNSDQN